MNGKNKIEKTGTVYHTGRLLLLFQGYLPGRLSTDQTNFRDHR